MLESGWVWELPAGWSGFIHHFKDVALELMPKWCGGSFHVTVWEKNFVSQEEIQRQDRQDGVSETGFTLPLEITTLQIRKCVWNNSFSRHWTSDSEGQWSVRNGKQDESSDYLCILAWESLQDTVQGMGRQAKPSGPSQLRKCCWESGETEAAEVCRTEYWRGESC